MADGSLGPWDDGVIYDFFSGKYEPIMHETIRGSYRVPVLREPRYEHYAVAVGYKEVRYFTDANAPPGFKALTSMIGAFPPVDFPSWAVNPTNAYIYHGDYQQQKDIGWRVTPKFSMYVMDSELLEGIRYGYDSRGPSKEEDKGGT